MKRLENAFTLPARVVLYVPGTRNGSEPLQDDEQKNIAENIAAFLSGLFGGATAERAAGYWIMDGGELVRENVVKVWSACSAEALSENLAQVIDEAERLRDELKQEAITIEINNTMYIL